MILKKILIVDDVEATRALTSVSLRIARVIDSASVIDEADCADAAVSLLATNTYDLIIADVHLPRDNGFDLATRIRREFSKDVPIIVISGYPMAEQAERHLRNGTITRYLEQREQDSLGAHKLRETILSLFPEHSAASADA